MKATISRWQLAEAAQVVKGLVAKDGLSVFSRVRLDASGSLSVTGSNGDVQVEWQMVGWIGTQGTVTVPGAEARMRRAKVRPPASRSFSMWAKDRSMGT